MKDVIEINRNIYCDKLLACAQGSLVNLHYRQSCDCLSLCGAVWCCVVPTRTAVLSLMLAPLCTSASAVCVGR